jgi:hypothetical protein
VHSQAQVFFLATTEDELRWSGGDGIGFPTVKNLYRALTDSMWAPTIRGWDYKLWKWNLVIKLKVVLLAALKKQNSYLGCSACSWLGRPEFLYFV